MKKIYILVLTLAGFITNYSAQTTWDGGGTTNNWNEAANWSNNTVPNGLVDVIFDGTSTKNCTFNVSIDCKSMAINSGYTGIISGNSGNHLIRGNFTVNDGTFNSTTGNLRILGSPTLGGGTFNHNSGIVTLLVDDITTTSIGGAFVFHHLRLQDNGLGFAQRNVNFGSTVTNSLTLDLTAAGEIWGYQGAIDIRSSLIILGTNTGIPTSNTAVFTFSGVGPIVITGAGSADMNMLPNVVMNTSGNISMTGEINMQGNWTGTQGTLTPGTSNTNFYGASASISGASAAFDNLIVKAGASLAFPASNEVLVARDFTNNGTVSFPSTSILGMNGNNTAQTIGGTGFTVGSIRAHPAGTARTITLNTPVVLIDSLKLENNVTFAAGNNLTLRSNASGTARLAELLSGASITGNVTVETFIPGGNTGWTNMGVRGVSGETIKSWDTYSATAGANGIPMTCEGCDYGVLDLGSYFESIQGNIETNPPPFNYDTTLTAASILTPGVGFWTYVGDGGSQSNGLTLINNGPLVTGPVSFLLSGQNTTDNLLANPYPSPISWDRLMNLGNNAITDGTYYIFSPDFGQVSWTGAISTPNGVAGDVIAGGQGFFVSQAVDGQNFNFTEAVKVSGTAPMLKSTAAAFNSFYLRIAGGNNEWDETSFFFHPDATPFYGKWDAKKYFQTPGYVGFEDPYSKYTTISSKDAQGKDYACNAIPLLTQDVTLPILARVSTTGTYTISAQNFQNINGCIILKDNLTNITKDLKAGPYVFTINDTTSTPRFDLLLCRDQTINPDGLSEIGKSQTIFINQDQAGPYVVTQFEQNTKATISVYNLIGQKLVEDVTVVGTTNTTQLNLNIHNQVVLIKVLTDKESVTKKIIVH